MKRDAIVKVEIDEAGRLHVVPASQEFPYIYREARWQSVQVYFTPNNSFKADASGAA
jgi:hypothetical protein